MDYDGPMDRIMNIIDEFCLLPNTSVRNENHRDRFDDKGKRQFPGTRFAVFLFQSRHQLFTRMND